MCCSCKTVWTLTFPELDKGRTCIVTSTCIVIHNCIVLPNTATQYRCLLAMHFQRILHFYYTGKCHCEWSISCFDPPVLHAYDFLLYYSGNIEWDCGCFVQYHWFLWWWVLLVYSPLSPLSVSPFLFPSSLPHHTQQTPLTWPQSPPLWLLTNLFVSVSLCKLKS